MQSTINRMKTILSVTKTINAHSEILFNIVADYHNGHQAILPKPPFVALKVLEGGFGHGTRIECDIKFLGKLTTFRATVTVPEEGKIIRETIDDGTITTYLFDEVGANKTAVTIKTEGEANFLFAYMTRKMLTPVYEREISMLESYAKELSHGSVNA